VPGKPFSDRRQHRADFGPANAFFDRLAAAGTGRYLPIGVKSNQFAAAKHALRLFGGAGDKFLHQHFIGEGAGCIQLPRYDFEISLIAHEPDAAARGA
jgi:hypothetical protein